jgi:hypothetical protein
MLKTNAANIHSAHDWFTLFTLLEVVGAGINPSPVMQCQSGADGSSSQVLPDAGYRQYLFLVFTLHLLFTDTVETVNFSAYGFVRNLV